MASHNLEFRDIYKEFYQRIHLYLERMVGKIEAEDLTQEVFLKVDKGLKDFKGESKLSTWVSILFGSLFAIRQLVCKVYNIY